MKKFLLATAAILMTGTAYAADAVVEEVVAVEVSAFSWTGFYVGANVGYGWTDGDLNAPAAPGISYISEGDLDGFMAGVYAGAQYQFTNNVVLGAEIDIQYRDGDSSAPLTIFGSPTGYGLDTELNWTGSARLKAGYAMDRWLPYIAGGFAFADYDVTVTALGVPVPEYGFDETSVGWTLGGGVEYAFTDNLIFRAEYRYSDFGNDDPNLLLLLGLPQDYEIDSHDISLGISYKF